jgi:beta-ribofuranosylaminobenzene 5'-phosphate synthase
MVTVETAGRLHFGFGNLSLAHDRLYGALGVAIDDPVVEVRVEPADELVCDHDEARRYARKACDVYNAPGAEVEVVRELPRHVGLGSGTQLALAVLVGVARAYDHAPAARDHAPELGRGGRSGIGVAAFEKGGFVLDSGHPASLFTSEAPAVGNWTVPEVAAHHHVPDDWRFLVVVPDTEPGRDGEQEDASMRRTVAEADPGLADRIAGIVVREVLPAVADGSAERFGEAISEVGRLNGTWYASEQGGTFRPPVGTIVQSLSSVPELYGAGQSSWGPAVYGVTDEAHADAARQAGRRALVKADLEGEVMVVGGRNTGAHVVE